MFSHVVKARKTVYAGVTLNVTSYWVRKPGKVCSILSFVKLGNGLVGRNEFRELKSGQVDTCIMQVFKRYMRAWHPASFTLDSNSHLMTLNQSEDEKKSILFTSSPASTIPIRGIASFIDA